jgi:predicted transcriptional regulator
MRYKMIQKLDKKKFSVSLKAINMAIINYVKKNGIVSTKDIIINLDEFSQASIYRAIKELINAKVIVIEKEVKVHSVMERYFKLNYDINENLHHEPNHEQYEDIVHAVNIWMSTVTSEIKSYLNEWVDTKNLIRFGMGRDLLHVSDKNFILFFKELQGLIAKYQKIPTKGDERIFSFSTSWVPIKKG